MITTVTTKNMVSIPVVIARTLGITPGCRLDWEPTNSTTEIRVRVIPKRGELARRLRGTGKRFSPRRDGVASLVAEREREDP